MSSMKPEGLNSFEARALELRRRTLEAVVQEFRSEPHLARTAMISAVQQMRLDAELRITDVSKVPDAHSALRECDVQISCFGRLLYFLRFGRCASDSTAEERQLLKQVGDDIAQREDRQR